ncbi:MAG: carotenoid 1,2-hydratase [Oscillospiraceae bacterium]|jgi:predicted secreted hydrolase|nr:carotenoid 1,2-hydratase [Oscillospiraceae bacterium]
MGKIVYTAGSGLPPTTFDDVWLAHKNRGEWWYCTGYLEDKGGDLFGYQFTLAKITVVVPFMLLICSVTDFRSGKHYNTQTPIFFGKGVTVTADTLAVDGHTRLTLSPNEHSGKGRMRLDMRGAGFRLDVEMEAAKPPVWHCDNGALQMGIPGETERTYYYSFTNLAARGSLEIGGKAYEGLAGKAWFDRQGGTYHITDPRCGWEWFSLRFFDNTEAMLFAFPQDDYYDGTLIEASGAYRRLNDYTIKEMEIITFEGKRFSNGWNLEMDGKKYTITPKISGMFNVFFFELLADIKGEDGSLLGYCFVELLPGVRNKGNVLAAFIKK